MTPLKIKLKNFRKIPAVEINLTGISLASIVGANGYGKSSTFAYAPLFALFGKPAPGCSLDDMVRTGQQDMSVTFEFEHNGDTYQVIRTRSTKGKGKSTYEFMKQIATGWQSLSGTTIKETDSKIEALLSLDANTFCASSLILQGDSSNFTKKLPGERKNVLVQILGLDIYEKLQSLAKEKEKSVSVKLEASKQTLERLSEELKNLPFCKGKLESIQQIITLTSIDLRTKETELADVQAVIKDLEAKQEKARQISVQVDDILEDIDIKQAEIITLNRKINSANEILESEPLVTAKVAELEQIKSQIPALEAKETRLRELQTEGKKLSKDEMTLADEQAELAKRITALVVELRKRDELKQANEDYQIGLERLKQFDEKAEKHQHFTSRLNIAETDLLKASTDLDTLLNEYGQLKKKVAILENSGCIDSAVASCRFLKDAQDAQSKIPELKEKIESGRDALGPLYEHRQALWDEIAILDYDPTVHANVKTITESLRLKAEQYAQLSGKEEVLQNLNEQKNGLTERIVTLSAKILTLNNDIRTLQTETENLPILKAQIPSLELYVKQKDRLPEAKATIQSAKEQIAKLDAEIEAKNKDRKTLQAIFLEFNNEVIGRLPDKQLRTNEIQQALKALQIDLNNLYVDQGTYQSKLDELNKSQSEYDRLKTELAPTAKELVRWQTLIKAFGKSGIPALIIENSIPELERISNDILSQMTNGQNSLRFDTQRDKKDGKGQIETLDIWVNDDSGYERIYETYSGGEALRIDLAIRLGLAELLANRAGSKVEFVVGDELFGSQDKEHTELVIQALKAIAPRFKKVLIITHIETAQAMFNQQIIMSEGGKVEIQFN